MPDWPTRYRDILRRFGWHEEADRASAAALATLATAPWPILQGDVVVLGCGSTLESFQGCKEPLVACDGATTRCREVGQVPDVVVTDLDGPAEDLLWAAEAGATMVVHAHGHNLAAIQSLAPRLAPLCGTHQDLTPRPPLRNLGGFTDGDRAVLLAEQCGATSIHLVAFDLLGHPGRYSHAYDEATKRAKMALAAEIIAEAATRVAIRPTPRTPHA